MSTRLQHAIRASKGRWIKLSVPVHTELTLLRNMVTSLAARPTHLGEIRPPSSPPPTWIGATDASLTGMGGVCYSPSREWHIFRLTFNTAIRAKIIPDDNPQGFLTINDLELAAYFSHLHIFAPCMEPLEHISIEVDNTDADIWDRRGSVITATVIGPLLREAV